MEKSLENRVFQRRSHWTTHEPEKAELEYTLSFLCFVMASTFIWASFLLCNERRVHCCSCRIWGKINTFPISNMKRRLKSLRHCTVNRLVLGLTSGLLVLYGTDTHPEVSWWLSFRWSTCPEDAFGMAWRSHCWNIFSDKHGKWVVHLEGLFAW